MPFNVKKEMGGTFHVDQSIEKRSDAINDRTCLGHWEDDTVLSNRGKDKGA